MPSQGEAGHLESQLGLGWSTKRTQLLARSGSRDISHRTLGVKLEKM